MAVITALAIVSCFPVAKSPQTVINDIENETVALVLTEVDGSPIYCSGVWVSNTEILTAAHCVEGAAKLFGVDSPLGLPIDYIDREDYLGVEVEPIVTHTSFVTKVDHEHDLALVKDYDPPTHQFAKLANSLPEIGERLHFVGHPVRLGWTYVTGTVASYREAEFEPTIPERSGPFLQVSANVYRGNSGGGAFDLNGRLVGICSMLAPAPNAAFYVHLDTIREFLK